MKWLAISVEKVVGKDLRIATLSADDCSPNLNLDQHFMTQQVLVNWTTKMPTLDIDVSALSTRLVNQISHQ